MTAKLQQTIRVRHGVKEKIKRSHGSAGDAPRPKRRSRVAVRLRSLPHRASTRQLTDSTSLFTMSEPNVTTDWQDRYFHIDQILDKAGPRTDPQFTPGDDVRRVALLVGRD